MAEETPDIFQILESFLAESFSSKYESGEFEELVEMAKGFIRDRMEKNIRRKEEEPQGPMPRRAIYHREPDIEDKLLESLRQSIKDKDEKE